MQGLQLEPTIAVARIEDSYRGSISIVIFFDKKEWGQPFESTMTKIEFICLYKDLGLPH